MILITMRWMCKIGVTMVRPCCKMLDAFVLFRGFRIELLGWGSFILLTGQASSKKNVFFIIYGPTHWLFEAENYYWEGNFIKLDFSRL